jgi:chemotaxis protein MotB
MADTAKGLKRGLVVLPVVAPLVLGGCVWLKQSEYDDMLAKDRQQQQQISAQQQQIGQQQQQLTANQQTIAANQRQIADDRVQIDRLIGAIKYTVNSDLLFASGSWRMSADGQEVIGKVASQLAQGQRLKLVVNGYTDNAPVGPGLKREGVTTNQELSQKRAETVMAYMITQGVRAEMVTAQGYGENNPIASNATPAGRAQNRRVEITVAGQS